MSESMSKAIKEELTEDFNAVITKAEQFLQSASHEGEVRGSALRGQVERNLRLAKNRLRDVEDAVTGRARATARAADAYVHENPWQTLGTGVGVGVALGVLIGMLVGHGRRRDE